MSFVLFLSALFINLSLFFMLGKISSMIHLLSLRFFIQVQKLGFLLILFIYVSHLIRSCLVVHPRMIALLFLGTSWSLHMVFSLSVRGRSEECGGINPFLFGVCISWCSFFMSLPFRYIDAVLVLSCCGLIRLIDVISVIFLCCQKKGSRCLSQKLVFILVSFTWQVKGFFFSRK